MRGARCLAACAQASAAGPKAAAGAGAPALRCCATAAPPDVCSTSSSGGGSGGSTWRTWAAPLLALPFAMAPLAKHASAEGEARPEPPHVDGLMPLESRRRIFFKYETRIRDNSTLEKLFEYFSSEEQGGVKYMLPMDLLAAIVPTYPASQSTAERAGYLPGERNPHATDTHKARLSTSRTIFRQFDLNGDGLLSYWEFLLVLTLLSIPEEDAAIIFSIVDLDGDGSVDAKEFMLVMDQLRSMSHVQSTSARQPSHNSEDDAQGLLVSFFGKNLKGTLKLPKFMDFLHQLHENLVQLEFAHYDVHNKGWVPGTDFAHSLLASSDVRTADMLLDRAATMPAHLQKATIKWKDFSIMHQLRRKRHSIAVALNFMVKMCKPVRQAEFKRIVKRVADVDLSPVALEIIFAVFAGEDGCLECNTFLDVLCRRDMMWAKEQRGISKMEVKHFKFWEWGKADK